MDTHTGIPDNDQGPRETKERDAPSNSYDVQIRDITKSRAVLTVLGEEAQYTVELDISADRANVSHCNCAQFSTEKPCAHTAAALSHFRSHSKSGLSPSDLPDRIRIRDVLAVAGEDDLRTFIRHESRRSNSLTVRLKTQFIENITLKPGLNKYAILLDEVLSVDTRGRLDLGTRDISLLNYIVESLLDTAKSHVGMRAYRDATEVLTTLLQKLHATVDKYGYDDPVLIENLLESYKLLEHLLYSDPAPELRDRIFDFGISLIDKPYYRLPDMRFNIVPVLMEACPGLQDRDEVMDRVVRRIHGSSDKAFWASWYCIINERYGTQPDRDLLSHQLSGSQIFTAVMMIEKIGALAAFDLALCTFGLNVELSGSQEIEWTRKVFDYARRTEDAALALNSGLQILSMTSDAGMLDTLVELLEGHPEIRHNFAARLQEEGNLPFLARLYALEGNYEDLLEVVNASRSIQLAGKHADILLSFAPEKARRVILDIVIHYATHHAGVICNENIMQFLEVLNEQGHRGLAKEIRTVLASTYPGRFQQI